MGLRGGSAGRAPGVPPRRRAGLQACDQAGVQVCRHAGVRAEDWAATRHCFPHTSEVRIFTVSYVTSFWSHSSLTSRPRSSIACAHRSVIAPVAPMTIG